jgi:hypothetical protein
VQEAGRCCCCSAGCWCHIDPASGLLFDIARVVGPKLQSPGQSHVAAVANIKPQVPIVRRSPGAGHACNYHAMI